MRRLFSAHRTARLPGGDCNPDDVHAHAAGAGTAVRAHPEPDPAGTGAADTHLPGQAAGGPAGERDRGGLRAGPARGRRPAGAAYASTSTLNPPYAIRFRSNGIGSFIIFAMRGSFITF